MFHVLIESGAHPGERRAGWTMTSAAVHAGLIAMAAALTLRDPVPPRVAEGVTPIVEWQPTPPRRTSCDCIPAPGPFVAPDPPFILVPTISVNGPVIGESIDPANLFDRAPVMTAGSDGPARPGPTGVHTGATVDRPVAPRSDHGSPTYPALLRSAGVEGDVAVRFVVDSTGRVETKSIAILEATHSAFAEAVRRWLLGARYFPAEVNGRPVRQLVEQRFGFTLRR